MPVAGVSTGVPVSPCGRLSVLNCSGSFPYGLPPAPPLPPIILPNAPAAASPNPIPPSFLNLDPPPGACLGLGIVAVLGASLGLGACPGLAGVCGLAGAPGVLGAVGLATEVGAPGLAFGAGGCLGAVETDGACPGGCVLIFGAVPCLGVCNVGIRLYSVVYNVVMICL